MIPGAGWPPQAQARGSVLRQQQKGEDWLAW